MDSERKWIVEPLIWEEGKDIHFDLPAICEKMGIPATKENEDAVKAILLEHINSKYDLKCKLVDTFDVDTEERMAKKFERQCQTMNERAQAWRKANPGKSAVIRWNFPPAVNIIGCISDALAHRLVTTNEAGLELIKALWPWGDRDEPTILMVRMVLEREPNDERTFRDEAIGEFKK